MIKQLKDFPRVSLCHQPTALEAMPRLSEALGGPNLWIKRDDCTGLATGGNKTRKLEFLIADAIECGAEDCDLNDDFYEISCSTEELHNTASLLESKINEDLAAQLSWKPINLVNVDEESAHKIIDMVNSLDDHDDVQEVFSNFDISEELLDKL